MTARFLLDENLSPKTSRYLRDEFGFDVDDIITRRLFGIGDEQVAAISVAERRAVITLDLDLGAIWHFENLLDLGVIIVRLKSQSIERVNVVLADFFSGPYARANFERTVVRLDGKRTKISIRSRS